MVECKLCNKKFKKNNGKQLFCSYFCCRKYWKTKLNPMKVKLARIKDSALKRGLEFNLDEADLIYPNICPVLKIPLNSETYGNKPSVDRIDNTKGYVKGNVRIISQRANRLKADASIEELELILADRRE